MKRLSPLYVGLPICAAMICGLSFSTQAHAASLTSTLGKTVGSATDLLLPSNSNNSNSDTPSITSDTKKQPKSTDTVLSPITGALSTTPSTDQSEQSTTPTTSTQTAATADTTQAPTASTTAQRTLIDTSEASATTANGQALIDKAAVQYGSSQLSSATANTLYRVAGAAAIVGFILYALASRPFWRGRSPFKRTIALNH